MKTLKICLLLSIASRFALAQKCDVKAHFEEVFGIMYFKLGDKRFPERDLAKDFKPDNCLAKIVPNKSFLRYLQEHFSKKLDLSSFSDYTDSAKTRKEYIAQLQKDEKFINLLNEWVEKVENPTSKDSLSFDEVLGIAVKYFSVNMNKDEKYTIKICSGINDILKTEPTRKPFLEAFCFSSILENFRAKNQYDMTEEVKLVAKELYKVNLGVDKQERIFRAQGALYMLMRKNEKLQKMLLEDYQKQKNMLPFVIKL
ncbi:MAG: hypothetical protein ACK40K_00085 [Raineya sp.]